MARSFKVGQGFKVRPDRIQKNAPARADEAVAAEPAGSAEAVSGVAAVPAGSADPAVAAGLAGSEGPAGSAGSKPVEVYGDVSVCRALRIRRRVIAAARTKESRGVDWDCVGLHAGMTWEWIARKAVELNVVPDFGKLDPIVAGDGVASCILMAVVPNPQRAIVDLAATGERRIVWVKDSTTMHLREIFDCFDDHGVLSARADLNACVY